MSRGLGRIERAILEHLMDDEDEPIYAADTLISVVYRPPDAPDDFDFRPTRAQYTAVLRAMHSLARKYPQSIKLSGGKGRKPLWLETDF